LQSEHDRYMALTNKSLEFLEQLEEQNQMIIEINSELKIEHDEVSKAEMAVMDRVHQALNHFARLETEKLGLENKMKDFDVKKQENVLLIDMMNQHDMEIQSIQIYHERASHELDTLMNVHETLTVEYIHVLDEMQQIQDQLSNAVGKFEKLHEEWTKACAKRFSLLDEKNECFAQVGRYKSKVAQFQQITPEIAVNKMIQDKENISMYKMKSLSQKKKFTKASTIFSG